MDVALKVLLQFQTVKTSQAILRSTCLPHKLQKSVQRNKKKMSLIIASGTNLGNRHSNLALAQKKLSSIFDFIAYSKIYESDPVDYLDQPRFLNQVLEFKLPLQKPEEVLAILKDIELEIGRVKNIPKGPRIIDLDIIFWGKTNYKSDTLIIPHPRALERSFVVIPLRELPFFNEIINDFAFQENFPTNIAIYHC